MSALEPHHYRPGDAVIGEADGETLMGVVVEATPYHEASGDVVVQWNEHDDRNVVPAALLRLWPARAHAARLAELGLDAPASAAAPRWKVALIVYGDSLPLDELDNIAEIASRAFGPLGATESIADGALTEALSAGKVHVVLAIRPGEAGKLPLRDAAGVLKAGGDRG